MTLSLETISQAMHWLVNGRTGMSSTCMLATIINGGPVAGTTYHPCDPADFKRCVGLLNAVPEFRNRLHVMKSISKHWANLVDHWDEIEKQMLEEISTSLNGCKTYDLMKCVLNGVATKEGV